MGGRGQCVVLRLRASTRARARLTISEEAVDDPATAGLHERKRRVDQVVNGARVGVVWGRERTRAGGRCVRGLSDRRQRRKLGWVSLQKNCPPRQLAGLPTAFISVSDEQPPGHAPRFGVGQSLPSITGTYVQLSLRAEAQITVSCVCMRGARGVRFGTRHCRGSARSS